MVPKVRLSIAAASVAALLVAPRIAGAAGPLPDPPAGVPAVPDTPTVTVTPGNGGATVEVGAGDTTYQVGAGSGGLSVGTHARGSKPGAGGGTPVDSMPVGTPGDRPGRRLLRATGGRAAVLFGAC